MEVTLSIMLSRPSSPKKRAGWKGVDSDYLFGNFLRLPRFRSMNETNLNRRIKYPPESLFSPAVLKDRPAWALAYTTIRRSENTNELRQSCTAVCKASDAKLALL